jgi:hypothetical protein
LGPPPTCFFTRVLHNGCNRGSALPGSDSWVVGALLPGGVCLGRRFYFYYSLFSGRGWWA